MSLLDQQNLLARVYTDPEFRASFYADPMTTGHAQGLCEAEIRELLLAAPAEVEFFSESLLWKRFHEVEKLLTELKTAMGGDFRPAFFEFAAGFNPTSIRKHHEDGLGFCTYIINRKDELGTRISDTARFERARLRFFNEGRILEVCRNRHSHDGRPHKILGYALWLRVGKRVLHLHL